MGTSHPSVSADRRLLVLYDSDCGFCKWLLSLLLRWDREERLLPVALQSGAAEELLVGLSPAERMESWHLVGPDRERRSGGEALPALLRALPGGGLPAAAFARLPGVTDRGYRWVAGHRSGLSRWVPAASKRRAARLVEERARLDR